MNVSVIDYDSNNSSRRFLLPTISHCSDRSAHINILKRANFTDTRMQTQEHTSICQTEFRSGALGRHAHLYGYIYV